MYNPNRKIHQFNSVLNGELKLWRTIPQSPRPMTVFRYIGVGRIAKGSTSELSDSSNSDYITIFISLLKW